MICTGKWLAQVKGDHKGPCEFSLVREDYQHGQRSLGWGDPDNKIILYFQECQDISLKEFNRLKNVTESYAQKLNAKDTNKC